MEVLEEELYKKEQTLIQRSSASQQTTLAKLTRELADKDAEIERMNTVLENKGDVENLESTNRFQESNIQVLKDMIDGLKSQLKSKDHDIERLKTRIENQPEDPYQMGSTPIVKSSKLNAEVASMWSSHSNFSRKSIVSKASLTKAKGPTAKIGTGERYIKDPYMTSPSKQAKGAGVQDSKPDILVKESRGNK